MPIVVVAVILFSFQLGGYQQQKSEYAFSAEMPDPAQVIRDIQGKDVFDTAVRRRAALSVIGSLLDQDLSKRRFPLTVREQALGKAYMAGIYNENQPYNGTSDSYKLYSQTMRLMADRSFTRPLLKRYFSEPALREMEPIVTNIEFWAQEQINQDRRSAAADSKPGPWQLFLKENGPVLQSFVLTNVVLFVLTVFLALRNAHRPPLDIDSKEPLLLPDSLRRISVFRKEYEVSCQSGKLYEKEIWTETNVTTTTSGGGAYQSGETVNYTPISTTTRVSSTVYNRFWLRSPEGREFWWRVSGEALSATTGQVISRIDSAGGHALMLYNHSTGQFASWKNWLSDAHKLALTGWIFWIINGTALAGFLVLASQHRDAFQSIWGWSLAGFAWVFAVWIIWAIPVSILNAIVRNTRNRQFEKKFVPAFRRFLKESTPELLARYRALPT
jgi:hypothetical protein